ncbi:MAG: type II toxin-antitoxin system PemK/MazF family toxin [Bifidobacteriaceae bacterium]|jgi:mRNA-degrading endonuclease toxin of MazEF toxin-antitoxin module|nr:type II toxin-antitoxin system PemK/MazF family toxin [Bifidobacteriaceae bacterium]
MRFGWSRPHGAVAAGIRVELEGAAPQAAYAQCEQLRAVSARPIGRRLGQADAVQMAQVSQVLGRLWQL